jgi:hypothetical protein
MVHWWLRTKLAISHITVGLDAGKIDTEISK